MVTSFISRITFWWTENVQLGFKTKHFISCGLCLSIMCVYGCYLINKQTKQHLGPLGFHYKQLLMYINSVHCTSCCQAQWICGRDRTKERSVPKTSKAGQQEAAAAGSKFSKQTSFITKLWNFLNPLHVNTRLDHTS